MRSLITTAFCVLAVASLLLSKWEPDETPDGRIPLDWATSSNPERDLAVEKFNELQPDLFLRLDVGNTGLDKILVQSSSGVGPDLFEAHQIAQLQAFVEAGIVWDLTPHAKKFGIDPETALWPAIWGDHVYEGRQYGYSAGVGVDLLFYNKNLFRKFGVSFPNDNMTWEEFFELAKSVTGFHPNINRHLFGVAGLYWHHFFYSQKGEYFSSDGTKVLVNSPAMRRSFNMQRRAIFADKITLSSIELSQMAGQGGFGGENLNQFGQGKFSMLVGGKWMLTRLRQFVHAQRKELKKWEESGKSENKPIVLELGVVRLPKFKDIPPSYHARSHVIAINKYSENREQALNVLKYLSSKEYSQFLINLPANPRHRDTAFGNFSEPELSDEAATRKSYDTLEFGYQPRTSPFLMMTDVNRVIGDQVARLEADPGTPVGTLLRDAEKRLAELMDRNLNRDPKLLKEFKRRRDQRAR